MVVHTFPFENIMLNHSGVFLLSYRPPRPKIVMILALWLPSARQGVSSLLKPFITCGEAWTLHTQEEGEVAHITSLFFWVKNDVERNIKSFTFHLPLFLNARGVNGKGSRREVAEVSAMRPYYYFTLLWLPFPTIFLSPPWSFPCLFISSLASEVKPTFSELSGVICNVYRPVYHQ